MRPLLFLAKIFVRLAWLIPGRPRRWAKRLMAERKAMLKAERSMRESEEWREFYNSYKR